MSGSATPTPPIHEAAARRDWPAFFERIEGRTPRATTIRALDLFDAEGLPDAPLAIDLACGSGIDTAEMLKRGWGVLAIDSTAEGIERLKDRKPAHKAGDWLRTKVATMEAADLPECHLLNASYALPFCPPAEFDHLWAKIETAVTPGGRFAGQFFGDRDSWASAPDLTIHTRERVMSLLSGWVLEFFSEDDKPSSCAEFRKHWHVFHVVARKR
ncbi:MAG: class I SAM-dependent methyltransferase [Planctomycetota bacterium]